MQKIAFQGLNLTHFQNRKLEGLSKTGKKLLEELQQKAFEPQVA